jgi:hypothetical protein
MDYTFVSDAGQTVDFTPKSFAPLGLNELWSLKNEYIGNRFSFSATDPTIDGVKQIGNASITASFKFDEPPEPFALIPGGWLPIPLASSQRFLVDRNVVDRLKKLHGCTTSTSINKFKFWMQFIEQEATLFNPLLYAWEGNQERKPSFTEFVNAFNEGASEIKKALPSCKVTNYTKDDYVNTYKIIENFAARAGIESKFLEIARPLITNRVKQGCENNIKEKLIKAAKESNLELNSITFVVTLSCLYDDPHGIKRSIGREVLKPNKSKIHNALSDIRSIEMTVINQILFGNQSFSLATRDHGLTSLWCALLPRGNMFNDNDIRFNFNLPGALFPRLNNDEIIEIEDLIKNSS